VSPFSLPVRRPIATLMIFVGLFVMGGIAWQRIPVELLPPVSGEQLYVSFSRPGSEPEVVEREILLPLQARAAELEGVEETWAEIKSSGGSFTVRFEPGTDLRVRELELRRLAVELVREQPRGSSIDVDSQDLSMISRFAMIVQVLGMEDRNSLLDFVEQRIQTRLAAVPGVANVWAGGGAPREMTVEIDPDLCAAEGVEPGEVTAALDRSVRRLQFLGGSEDEAGRTAVVLDGRPRGVVSLGNIRIRPDRATLLRHVAHVELGTGREEMLFRVNGKPTVALVIFQDEGANLIRLGRDVRERLDGLSDEFADYGLEFVINFDAAEVVEEQLDRLKWLACGGFVIALVVLFLFLRQWRAVAVVAIAVPASLLTALALLFLTGQSINLITLFGLAVGIGMLVDNSIVVYEAVQRRLEHGAEPDAAAEMGVRRTVRAILAATLTNAIVFLPIVFIDFNDGVMRSLLEIMALAILLPLIGSVLVAIGLVPLLARRLAAPAALKLIAERRKRRQSLGGLAPPDQARELFGAVLTVALRRPTVWVAFVLAAVLLTVVIAIPWVAVGTASQEPPEAKQIRFSVETESTQSLARTTAGFEAVEGALMELEGLRLVESMIREEGGSITVHLLPKGERPDDVNATRVRQVAREAARSLKDLRVNSQSQSFGGGGGGSGSSGGGVGSLLGTGPARTVISGSDSRVLAKLANDIETQLSSIPQMGAVNVDGGTGQREMRVLPMEIALRAYGLTADQVLPALSIVRREGVTMRTGFTQHDGREIPMTVRRLEPASGAMASLSDLRLSTPAGVLPLSALARVREMSAPPTILHHNGRREIGISYRLGDDAPKTGPSRQALDADIENALQGIHRPVGYTIETPDADESFSWFKKVMVPVVLLLFAALALTFESVTLPLLVMLSLPLTVLGATWSLVLSGMPADYMALVGTLALIGLTVNPAILLVDRMQQRAWEGGMSAGAAALAAVRERARPVLMTATTTIAGLWPLAIATGAENEIWPPFATVVMGGLATSTLLTLLFIPVGFVFLHRLDRLFGRLGPWILIGWIAASAAVMAPLILSGTINSTRWQVITTLLVAAALLAVIVMLFRKPELPTPKADDGPPAVEVRHLYKTYGKPGPVGRAWRVQDRFANAVRKFGGSSFYPREARGRLMSLLLISAGTFYLAFGLQTIGWRLIFLLISSAVVAALFKQIGIARGKVDDVGRSDLGGIESLLAVLAPWIALVYHVFTEYVIPMTSAGMKEPPGVFKFMGIIWIQIAIALMLLVGQFGRRTAVRLARGMIAKKPRRGSWRRFRSWWRGLSRGLFGLDLPREQVRALSGVDFVAERGMVGILGPNGAGKTTLLRMLAGILDPSVGKIYLGGVPLDDLRRYLARYVGYLPQEFGLPKDLTARQYLEYYALHYELGDRAERDERVSSLLKEVGLAERADEKIGGFSGGMRQRVAVARTLLRLPPVIIVDEPTVGLDPRERIRFRNLLSRLAEGRVVLFSTHVVEDVEVACERVLVMGRGTVLFDGAPHDLASVAEGKVWVVSLEPGEEESLLDGSRVVDQVPEPGGRVRTRVLSDSAPVNEAEAARPTLEDGYLWLVSDHEVAA